MADPKERRLVFGSRPGRFVDSLDDNRRQIRTVGIKLATARAAALDSAFIANGFAAHQSSPQAFDKSFQIEFKHSTIRRRR